MKERELQYARQNAIPSESRLGICCIHDNIRLWNMRGVIELRFLEDYRVGIVPDALRAPAAMIFKTESQVETSLRLGWRHPCRINLSLSEKVFRNTFSIVNHTYPHINCKSRIISHHCTDWTGPCEGREPTCCARRLLTNEPDLRNGKTMVQKAVEARGHLFITSPRFHCEL